MNKKKSNFSGQLGFVLAAYLKLPSVAVAAIGIIIVVL